MNIQREHNVISFLHRHAELFPQRTALQWVPRSALAAWGGKDALPYESINYGDMAGRVARIACGLKELGLGRGDTVLLFVPMSLEMYLLMFAVQHIGAIAVFLDSWARRDQLGVCARCVEPKAMISFAAAFDLCRAVPELADIPLKIVVGKHDGQFSADLEGLLASGGVADIEPVAPEETALITFTTGSSGVPKGANRTHGFLVAQHLALDKVIPYRDDDVDLPVFPIFSLNNLAAGVTTVLPAIDLAAPSEGDAAAIVNQLTSCGVTCCTLSPSILNGVADYCLQQGITLAGLRRIVTGGAPVGRESVRRIKAAAPNALVWILYGSTEVEPIAHIEADEMFHGGDEKLGVNVGRISDDLEYKFIRICKGAIELGPLGWQEWEVKPGEVGELVVNGPHVCQGYYRNPEATQAVKIADPAGKLWHRTGDLVFQDDMGNLWFVGRVHNAIARGGASVFPVQAEMLLKKLDFVHQGAFVGLPDGQLGERCCAVVSLKVTCAGNEEEGFRQRVRAMLEENGIPVDEVRIVAEIPMDPRHHSKVEYTLLRKQLI